MTTTPSASAVERDTIARAIHTHLCRRDIMQYLDNPEDCTGLADAVLAALAAQPAAPSEAYRAGLEVAAKVAEAHKVARFTAAKDAHARRAKSEARDHESMAIEAVHIAAAIRALTSAPDRFAGAGKAMAGDHIAGDGKMVAMREALEPSGDTKAAYSGEIEYTYVELDEFGDERTVKRLLDWTTIKEVMAMIRARAAIASGDGS